MSGTKIFLNQVFRNLRKFLHVRTHKNLYNSHKSCINLSTMFFCYFLHFSILSNIYCQYLKGILTTNKIKKIRVWEQTFSFTLFNFFSVLFFILFFRFVLFLCFIILIFFLFFLPKNLLSQRMNQEPETGGRVSEWVRKKFID